MPFTNTGKNLMLDYFGTQNLYMALYSDDNGTTEITGGSYVRKAITWASASAGAKSINGTMPVFDIPSGATVRSAGFVTAVTAGTQNGLYNVTDETYGGAGTYTVNSASISITD